MSPAAVWVALFLFVPCAMTLWYGFQTRGAYGGVIYDFNFANFARVLADPYLQILIDTLRVSFTTVILCVVIGFIVAFCITKARERHQTTLLMLVMIPFWTNYLIRTYAWIVLLNPAGLINGTLMRLGLIDTPLNLIYNEGAVLLGLTYSYLPFAILTIFSSLKKLNPELLEASQDLGAGIFRTTFKVIVPHSLPAILASAIFIFVLSIGNFVTPDLLGGGHSAMLGNAIYDQFMKARDWPMGSAIALVLLTIMTALLVLQSRVVNRKIGGAE